MQFGLGYLNWGYLTHCAAPAPGQAELWAAPMFGVIIFVVGYLVVLLAKFHKYPLPPTHTLVFHVLARE